MFPQPGWVEHDPDGIWETQLSAAEETLHRVGITADEVVAVGVTNQRETTILWERYTGRPIYNAIVWQDRRTAEAIETLKASEHAPLSTRENGLGARLVLFREQDCLASRQYRGRTAPRRGRRTRLWDRRHLVGVSTHAGGRAPMLLMPRTPPARCSTTSTRASGTLSYSSCSPYHRRFSQTSSCQVMWSHRLQSSQ